MNSRYYENLGAGRKTYDAVLDCLKNHRRGAAVGGQPAVELLTAVLQEHPELFYVTQEFAVSVSLLKREVVPRYLYSVSEEETIRRRLEDTAQEILQECINGHQSDYDKIKSLHDYLKVHLEYDTDAAGNRKPKDRRSWEAHNIVGGLLHRKCVCEGYSKSMKFLCDRIGLECWVVSGTGSGALEQGPHSWNIVNINGYYHHVDVTWDHQYAESSNIPNYGYLNLCDEEIAKDHTWNRRHYPVCPSDPYNYFRVNNSLIDTRAQLETFLYNCFQMEEEYIMFKVVRGSQLEREINGCLQDSVRRAYGRCRHVSVGNYKYGGIPEQLTFFIQPEYRY